MKASVMLVLTAVTMTLGSVAAIAAPGTQQITLAMTEFKYTPAQVVLRGGTPAEITLTNKGTVEHEFMVYERPKAGAMAMDLHDWTLDRSYFRGLNPTVTGAVASSERKGKDLVMLMLAPGKTVAVKFTPKRTGTFEIGCMIPGHYEAGMKGTLVVR